MKGPYRTPRNNGWGRTLEHAAASAIEALYVAGHFGTVAALKTRVGRFLAFLRVNGVRDLMAPEMLTLVGVFGQHVRVCVELGIWSQKYGVSLISAVNVLMRAVRGEDQIWFSPAKTLGRRSQVRSEIPDGMDRAQVEAAVRAMRDAGCRRAGAVLELSAAFGLRLREACLADLVSWHKEAAESGQINVQHGTKGGRKTDRYLSVDEEKMAVLERALAIRPKGSRNLVSLDERYVDLVAGEIADARPILKSHGIDDYRENRAAYACRRYKQLTGFDAPLFTGGVLATGEADLRAREIISRELGHGRTDVVAAYIGGRKRAMA